MNRGDIYVTQDSDKVSQSVLGVLVPLHRGFVSEYMAGPHGNQVPREQAHSCELAIAQAWPAGTAM